MRKLAALLAAWLLFAGPSFPAHAQVHLVLTAAEREVLEWFRDDEWLPAVDPAVRYVYGLRRTLRVEEVVRRQLLLNRCPRYPYPGDQMLDEGYVRLVDEATRAVQAHLQPQDYAERGVGGAAAGVVFAFRRADEATRAAWLAYMRTADARHARDWREKIAIVGQFREDYAFDVSIGLVHGGWLHWFGEFLHRAGLFEVYVDSADSALPGLGRRFAAFTAERVSAPLQEAQRRVLNELSEELKNADGRIGQRLLYRLSADVHRLLDRWDEQPLARMLESAQERVSRLLASGGVDDAEMKEFLLQAAGDRKEILRREDALVLIVQGVAKGRCAAAR